LFGEQEMAQYDEELINKIAEWIYHESSEPISEIEYLLKKSDAVGEYMDAVEESKEEVSTKEGIDDDGIDPASGKQRIGLEGGYDFDEYTVDADSDGVLVTFGNDEIEIERSDWNEGELSIKVNGESISENSKEVSEDEGIQRLKSLISFRT
jgi:hypothetical protein